MPGSPKLVTSGVGSPPGKGALASQWQSIPLGVGRCKPLGSWGSIPTLVQNAALLVQEMPSYELSRLEEGTVWKHKESQGSAHRMSYQGGIKTEHPCACSVDPPRTRADLASLQPVLHCLTLHCPHPSPAPCSCSPQLLHLEERSLPPPTV